MEPAINYGKKPGRSIKRSVIIFIGNVIGITILAFFGLGVEADRLDDIILLVLAISLINAVLWPILTRIMMPFLVLTFGIGTLLLNGILLILFAPMFDIQISGLAVFLVPLSMALWTTLLCSILTINDYAPYYRSVIRDAKRKRKKEVKRYPGVIIVEIDGLAHDILVEATEKGYMPTVKSLLDNESHKLKRWETDLSSQTGASQAGILHGNNENITAFRWIEKENDNQMMQCSGIEPVKILEERISDGNGLLVDNGASRSNLFSGDTDNVIFTFSKISEINKLYNNAWFSIFSNPSNFARIVILILGEMIREIISQLKHYIFDIRPRIKRGIKYMGIRAGTNVYMREINTGTLIGDILVSDIDVAYSTYLGYDEIAHHSGIRDEDSWYALRQMDKQIAYLIEAAQYTSREYQFVIQSDHGQSNGATFTQRYGETFEEFVKSLLPQDITMFAKMSSNEDHFAESYIPFSEQIEKLQNRTPEDEEKELSDSEVVILASGNLAMIYFTQWENRLTYEEIDRFFPELIPGILKNEYIGFIVLKSCEEGNIVLGKDGKYYLDSDEVEGENPLEGFGDNIARHIRRNISFKYTPDILVNSFYDSQSDEVCAFEELIGSHGGAGGSQSEPFILYPSDWDVPEEEIIGAENIYKVLKGNLKRIKEEYNDDN